MIKVTPRYEDNKTYPILVKMGGYHKIVEMLGIVANRHNEYIKNGTIEIKYVGTTI